MPYSLWQVLWHTIWLTLCFLHAKHCQDGTIATFQSNCHTTECLGIATNEEIGEPAHSVKSFWTVSLCWWQETHLHCITQLRRLCQSSLGFLRSRPFNLEICMTISLIVISWILQSIWKAVLWVTSTVEHTIWQQILSRHLVLTDRWSGKCRHPLLFFLLHSLRAGSLILSFVCSLQLLHGGRLHQAKVSSINGGSSLLRQTWGKSNSRGEFS